MASPKGSPKGKRIDRLEAFKAYAAQPFPRSINGLTRLLKERGFAVSRNTLQEWCREERWETRVTDNGAPLPEMHLSAAVALRAAQDVGSGADRLFEAMDTMADFSTMLVRQLQTYISALEPTTIDDFIRLTDCARFVVRTMAESKAALAAAAPAPGDGAKLIDARPDGPSDAELALASFRVVP